MKTFFLGLVIVCSGICHAQTLKIYTDSAQRFRIGVPEGWVHTVPADGRLALMVLCPVGEGRRENYNINIYKSPARDMETAYTKFKAAIASASGSFKILEEGEKTVNGRKYKWFIETHKNRNNAQLDMHNYVFFTYANGMDKVLTMVTVSTRFESQRTLFEKIAGTLQYW